MKPKIVLFVIFCLITSLRIISADVNESNIKRIQLQPRRSTPKWHSLQIGTDERKVRNLLGEPILIQGGSDLCIWYYQCLPDSNTKEEINGIVTFKAKAVDQLLEEEKKEFIENIEKLNKAYRTKRCNKNNNFKVCDKNKCYYFYRENDSAPYYYSYKFGENTPDDYSLPVIIYKPIKGVSGVDLYNADGSSVQAMLRSAAKFNGQFERFRADYERAVKILTEGRVSRIPVFQVISFKLPDLSQKREPPVRIKPQETKEKWHFQHNWQQLKINMTADQVHHLIGRPGKNEANTQYVKEYYGDIPGYGELCFSSRSGRNPEERLDSWIEPFWSSIVNKKIEF